MTKIKKLQLRRIVLAVIVLLVWIAIANEASAQVCVPPPSGLISWWPAEGNANDIAGGNNGALQGSPTYALGMVNQGFSFNGLDQFLEVPSNPSLNLPRFSVDAWIYIDPAQTVGQFNTIIGKGSGGSGEGGFFLTHDDRNFPETCSPEICGFSTNGVTLSVFGGAAVRSVASIPNAFPTAGFYFVAGTFDGSVSRLYLNGNLVSTGMPINSVLFNNFPLRIGALNYKEVHGPNDRFKGIIDEVELFNRELTAAEIQALFNAGSAGKCPMTNHPPVASAGPDQTVILSEAVQLNGSLSSDPDGTITSFQWTFGDGGTANSAIVPHVYATAGTFTANLTVTDNKGATASDSAVVTVLSPAQAIQVLIGLVANCNLKDGITNSLDSKLQSASDALQAANSGLRQNASNSLASFINEVEAQRGKQLDTACANGLEALAQRIAAAL